MTEDEIQERVRFKVEALREGIINRMKNFKMGSWVSMLEHDNARQSEFFRGKQEAFEEFKAMFDKEINMPTPYDDMAEQRKRRVKDKAVNELMAYFDDKLRGRVNGNEHRRYLDKIVRIIENVQHNIEA